MRSRSDRGAAALAAACALVALLGASIGCQRRAETPQAAWQRFAAAVNARDARTLYAALDLATRWSWMTVRRSQREAHDIVLGSFPEGPAREQQLRRFEAAALAEDERDLFVAWLPVDRWDELARDLPADATPTAAGSTAEVRSPQGKVWPFRRGDDGSWGFSGMADEAEQLKRRALADLELVRDNATDIERAATRAGK